MQRREFLIGTAVGVAALAVAPSVLAEPTLPDLGLFPRQELMRQRARTASEVHLLWGQRSGKGRTAAAIVADRIARTGALSICLVGHWDSLNTTYSHYLRDWEILGFPLHEERTYTFDSPKNFLEHVTSADIVVLNEVDWQDVPAHRLINHAREISPFLVSESTPCRRNSDYMNYVLFHGSMGTLGDAWDWASTWEINPNVTERSLEGLKLVHPAEWERDFLVYKQHASL